MIQQFDNMTAPHVLVAMHKVQASLAAIGIDKTSQNKSQGWPFRGIDAVMETLSGLLADNHLLMLPQVLSREIRECESKGGGVIFYSTLMVQYNFVSCIDGSSQSITVCGEAMDSGDKSVNKALSIAYKYAVFQAFCVPLKGILEDADSDTYQPVSRSIASPTRSTINHAPDPYKILTQLGAKFGHKAFKIEGWINMMREQGHTSAIIIEKGQDIFGKANGEN